MKRQLVAVMQGNCLLTMLHSTVTISFAAASVFIAIAVKFPLRNHFAWKLIAEDRKLTSRRLLLLFFGQIPFSKRLRAFSGNIYVDPTTMRTNFPIKNRTIHKRNGKASEERTFIDFPPFIISNSLFKHQTRSLIVDNMRRRLWIRQAGLIATFRTQRANKRARKAFPIRNLENST